MADHIADGRAPGPGQPALGVVMLDTVFPRPPGDIGNQPPLPSPRATSGCRRLRRGAWCSGRPRAWAVPSSRRRWHCRHRAAGHRHQLRLPCAAPSRDGGGAAGAVRQLGAVLASHAVPVCGGPEAVGVLTASAGALSDAHRKRSADRRARRARHGRGRRVRPRDPRQPARGRYGACRAGRWWRRRCALPPRIRACGRWCWNAPICRPMRPRSRSAAGCRCSTRCHWHAS